MRKNLLILVTALLFVFNLVIPTSVLSKGWKGEGTKIEFESMPILTMKDFLNGVVPEKRNTIWGTLNFPANAPDKNVPVVVLLHGMGGIHESAEFWLSALNNMGLATFMVDSNWARKKCKKDSNLKKDIPWCAAANRGMNRVIDGYGALKLLSNHPRIDPKRIGCLGISLGARGCLYLNVKRFQKMWGTPSLEFAVSVPMYPPCNVIFKEDDEITDTIIRIHVGELDTYFPFDSCVNYAERLRAKGKDVQVKVYPDAHHGFDAKMDIPGGGTKWVTRGHNDGRCYYEENASLPVEEMAPDDVAIITQIGFNEWYASATEKGKKKIFKRVRMRHKMGWRIPQVWHDRSCISKSTTLEYNKDASEEATKLVKDFFTTIFKLQ